MAINPHWDEGNTPPAGTITDYDLGKGGRSTLGINEGGSQYDVPSWYFDPITEGSTNDYSRWTGMHHGALQPAGGPTGIETAVPYFEQRNLFSGPNYRGEPEQYNPNFFKDMMMKYAREMMAKQVGEFSTKEPEIMIKEKDERQRKYLEERYKEFYNLDDILFPSEFGDPERGYEFEGSDANPANLLGMTSEFGGSDLLGMTGEFDMSEADSYSPQNLFQLYREALDAGNEDEAEMYRNDIELRYPTLLT